MAIVTRVFVCKIGHFISGEFDYMGGSAMCTHPYVPGQPRSIEKTLMEAMGVTKDPLRCGHFVESVEVPAEKLDAAKAVAALSGRDGLLRWLK